MTRPISNEDKNYLDAIRQLEKQTEGMTVERVPKKGIFSFGRKQTKARLKDGTSTAKMAKITSSLKLASFSSSLLSDPTQKKEARKTLANIARNLRDAEETSIKTQKNPPSRTQIARIRSLEKIIKKGENLT